MKRKDLELGMVVELRGGLKGIVVRAVVESTTIYCKEDKVYTYSRNDLYYLDSYECDSDIIKVFTVDLNIIESECNLIWKEKEDKNEYTIKELEELTGINNLKIKK